MMVGQTCMECQYGPKGLNSCKTDDMDKWSLNTPQPCGAPRPNYVCRVQYHNRIVRVWGLDSSDLVEVVR